MKEFVVLLVYTLWHCTHLELVILDFANSRQVQISLRQSSSLKSCKKIPVNQYVHKNKNLKVLSLEWRRWFMIVIGLITHSRRLWDSDVWSSQAGWASDQSNHFPQRNVLLLLLLFLLLAVAPGELALERVSSPRELAPSSSSRALTSPTPSHSSWKLLQGNL